MSEISKTSAETMAIAECANKTSKSRARVNQTIKFLNKVGCLYLPKNHFYMSIHDMLDNQRFFKTRFIYIPY